MTFFDALLTRARDFGLAVYPIESKGRAPTTILIAARELFDFWYHPTRS